MYPAKRGRLLRRFLGLGLWQQIAASVAAAAILALLAFFGHLIFSHSNASAAGHKGSGSDSTAAPTVSREGSATPTPSPDGSATASNGTQLASYSFQLTNGFSAPLGLTAPTQTQMGPPGSSDITFNGIISAGVGERMVSLPDGSTPTYSACATDTVFVTQISQAPGVAFCIIETTGRIAGVTVTSVNNSPNFVDVALKATLWQDVQ